MEDNKIEIDLSSDEMDSLVRVYVDASMREVSKQLFSEVFNETNDIREALYSAAINEVTNLALETHISSLEKGKQ